MRRTWTFWSGIRIALSMVFAGAVLVLGADAWNAWRNPQAYPFAAEGPSITLWVYRSQAHYLAAACITMLAAAIAIAGLWPDWRSPMVRYVCMTPAVLVIAWWFLGAFSM